MYDWRTERQELESLRNTNSEMLIELAQQRQRIAELETDAHWLRPGAGPV
jgi:hypothetical protein